MFFVSIFVSFSFHFHVHFIFIQILIFTFHISYCYLPAFIPASIYSRFELNIKMLEEEIKIEPGSIVKLVKFLAGFSALLTDLLWRFYRRQAEFSPYMIAKGLNETPVVATPPQATGTSSESRSSASL